MSTMTDPFEITEEEYVEGYPFYLSGDLRDGNWQHEDNYGYRRAVIAALPERVLDSISFDCEYSCFYAYAKDRETVEALASAIRKIIHPAVGADGPTPGQVLALDEAVHDVASQIATDICNRGGQVEYLLANGVDMADINNILLEA